MEELEIQYSQALAKPKQETISHKILLEALAFKATRIFLYNPLDRNIIPTTNLVHKRNTVCEGDSTVAIILYVCSGFRQSSPSEISRGAHVVFFT